MVNHKCYVCNTFYSVTGFSSQIIGTHYLKSESLNQRAHWMHRGTSQVSIKISV